MTVLMIVSFLIAAGVVFGVARRRRTYWWVASALIAASYAATALASFFALRMFIGTLEEIARVGGGIGAVSFGIWQATQVPFVATWIVVLATVVAGVFMLVPLAERNPGAGAVERPAAFAAATALTLVAGAAPVLFFRRAIAFVLRTITPATAPHIDARSRYQAVMGHLTTAALVSATCFIVVTLLLFAMVKLARTSKPSPRLSLITIVAVIVSLGIAGSFAASLHASSVHFRDVALHGGRVVE